MTTLSADQRRALNLMLAGENVFLTGKAGTGKSFVIHEFLRKKSNVIKCAPTGIAALAIGGATLHQTFLLGVGLLDPQQDYFMSRRGQKAENELEIYKKERIWAKKVKIMDQISA